MDDFPDDHDGAMSDGDDSDGASDERSDDAAFALAAGAGAAAAVAADEALVHTAATRVPQSDKPPKKRAAATAAAADGDNDGDEAGGGGKRARAAAKEGRKFDLYIPSGPLPETVTVKTKPQAQKKGWPKTVIVVNPRIKQMYQPPAAASKRLEMMAPDLNATGVQARAFWRSYVRHPYERARARVGAERAGDERERGRGGCGWPQGDCSLGSRGGQVARGRAVPGASFGFF